MTSDKLQKKLIPPSRWTGDEMHHWVRNREPEKGNTDMEVWQWVPDVAMWSRPNQMSDLRNYDYVGVCPLPPSPKDVEQALHVYRSVLESPTYLGFSEELRAVFRRMWAKHVGCIHPIGSIKKRKQKAEA